MSKKNLKIYKRFEPRPADFVLRELKSKPASFWERKGENMALDLFKFVYENVPAYKKFLKKNKVPARIGSLEDFKKLPLTAKKDYLRKSDYPSLFPFKDVSVATTISATSGSTGEPFYFPRADFNDAQYERLAEVFLENQFSISSKKTLGIIGFGLGIWIGGMFTYKNLNRIAQKGYPLTLAPVGANKDIYLKTFKKFAPHFDQVILMGYPPFVKDVLDSGKEYGVNWNKHNIKILTAAEGYSEDFRKYVAKKARIKNFLCDIINMYGTVEQGTIANETSFGNLIRKIASENKKAFKALFPRATNIPTLTQYFPNMVYFEEIDGHVVATNYGSSIPLIRYSFSDLGGVIGFDEMLEKLQGCGIDIIKEARKNGIEKQILHLPFVYVYARSDFAVVFRGANIYPEEIRAALDNPSLNKYITGRATMIRKEDGEFNQQLNILIELRKKVYFSRRIKRKISRLIIEHLRINNSEFSYLYSLDAKKTTPVIFLKNFKDQRHFSDNGKHHWVKVK